MDGWQRSAKGDYLAHQAQLRISSLLNWEIPVFKLFLAIQPNQISQPNQYGGKRPKIAILGNFQVFWVF